MAQSVSTHVADNTVAPAADALILMDARGCVVTLADAHTHAGLPCTVKNTSSGGQTTIVAQHGQSIDGKSTYKLGPPLAYVRLECDGANYWVVASG